jgi:mRNA-degrading endonuclease RelE of RelBE toxin-antitoxin system
LWNFDYKPKFVKQYKLLSSNLQKKVKVALDELANSENPLKMGEYKSSLRAYAYVLDKSNRILYNVRFGYNIIELLRIGDHKKAYKGQ